MIPTGRYLLLILTVVATAFLCPPLDESAFAQPTDRVGTASSKATSESDGELTDADLLRLGQLLRDPEARSRVLQTIDTGPAELAPEVLSAHPPTVPSPELMARRAIEFASMLFERYIAPGKLTRDVQVYGRVIVARTNALLADEYARNSVLEAILAIAACVFVAISAALVASRFARRVESRRNTLYDDHRHHRRSALAILAVFLVPVAFLTVGYVSLEILAGRAPFLAVAFEPALYSVTAAMTIATIANITLSPLGSGFRLLPIDDEPAAYAYIWIRRLAAATCLPIATAGLLAATDVPRSIKNAIEVFAGLPVAALAIVCILQNRQAIASTISGGVAAEGHGKIWRLLRHRFAAYWHYAAIFLVLAAFLVWAMDIPGGLIFLLRGSFVTIAAIVVSEWMIRLVGLGVARFLSVGQDLRSRFPFLETRANLYSPLIVVFFSVLIRLASLGAVLAGWQIDVGRVLLASDVLFYSGKVLSLLGTCLVAAIVWELVNGIISYRLEARDGDGNGLIRNARIRTLLPLLRNVVLVVVVVFAALSILSQLGMDITPILAGAGVVGLAIGFGSQTLVKDVIAGAFILAEDTIAVGDVAMIDGTGGLVEGMTIRTIRLRDLSGNVHTIPFGAISKITNLTKDFSYYLIDVGVAYRVHTDTVVKALRDVFDDIRADPRFSADIIGDFEVLGVDRFADSAVYVRARIKSRPLRQWDIGREFNRRMKILFDERGIELPFPQRTVHLVSGPHEQLNPQS